MQENINCLANMKCPDCGSKTGFKISGHATFEVTDSGSEAVGSHDWDSDSACRCTECSHSGKVRDFNFSNANAVVVVMRGGKIVRVLTNGDRDVNLSIVDMDRAEKMGIESEIEHNLEALSQHVVDEEWDEDDCDRLVEGGLEDVLKAADETAETIGLVDYKDDHDSDADSVDTEDYIEIDWEKAKETLEKGGTAKTAEPAAVATDPAPLP